MTKKIREKKLSVEFGENGLPYIEADERAYLSYSTDPNGTLCLSGNKHGLLLLAKSLLGLAECERDDGYHIHLDDLYDLNDEGKFIIINKVGL